VVLRAAIARHEAASGRIAAAPRSHAHAVFAVCASARHVRLRGDRVPSTGHRACRCARDVQDDGALGCVDDGACDAGSREESAGAAAAARVLCCVFNACCSTHWQSFRSAADSRSRCSNPVTLFIPFVQAAAAARIVGMPDIVDAAGRSDGTLVYCHLVVDCHRVNCTKKKVGRRYGKPLLEQQSTPLLLSAEKGDLEICRLLLQCNANVQAKDRE
jgi:hypothetical protein